MTAALADAEAIVAARLVDLIGDGDGTLVAAPWRHDGHPDHEAAGRAAAVAARRTDASLVEYPIWWWHWGAPDDAPWQTMRRLDLARAPAPASATRSPPTPPRSRPLSDLAGRRGAPRTGPAGALRAPGRAVRPRRASGHRPRRPAPHPQRPVGGRRAVVRGAQARPHAGDAAAPAPSPAASRSAARPGPDGTARRALRGPARGGQQPRPRSRPRPVGWPTGPASAVQARQLPAGLAGRASSTWWWSPRSATSSARASCATWWTGSGASLAPDGVVVLCHWRHPVDGWVLDARRVHAAFAGAVRRPVQATYRDRDVEIVVLGADGVLPEAHE